MVHLLIKLPYIISLLALTAAFSACTVNETSSNAETQCDLSSGWSIQFSRSGGIAGRSDTLIADHTGKLIASSKRPQQTIETFLDQEKILALEKALQKACPFEKTKSPQCADCFTYSLESKLGDQNYFAEFNDLSPNPDVMALAQFLVQLMGDALSH